MESRFSVNSKVIFTTSAAAYSQSSQMLLEIYFCSGEDLLRIEAGFKLVAPALLACSISGFCFGTHD